MTAQRSETPAGGLPWDRPAPAARRRGPGALGVLRNVVASVLALCAALGSEALRHARIHHDIVARFGRFPHRNALLARRTTADERAFLEGGGFAG